jgi:micrococcal nuclease
VKRTRARRRAFFPLAIAGILAATGLAACSSDGSVKAEVVRVVDGDTFEAKYGNETKTVRLLNIDTPETKHPNKIIECQGPEATKFLEGKLPAGTAVTLRFDQEKTDGYNRVLAAAFLGDELVNASIARAGLGVAKEYRPNTKYYGDVKAAQDEAAQKKAGLFQDNLSCSPAAVAGQQLAALAAAPADPGAAAGSGELTSVAGKLATALAAAKTASSLLGEAKDAVVAIARSTENAGTSAAKLTTAVATAESRHKTLTDRAVTVKAEEDRIAAEAKAAEAKRLADEAAAKAAAEARAKAAAEAQAAAEAAARAVPPAPTYVAPSQPYVAPAPAPVQQNPYPGYTGPRCYAPGGKSWRPC